MTEQKPIIYQKLIRDRIPEIIKSNGKKAHIREIRGKELRDAVGRKILEEAFELFEEWQKESREDILKTTCPMPDCGYFTRLKSLWKNPHPVSM